MKSISRNFYLFFYYFIIGLAVRKVDELTHQLDDLRNGRVSNHFPPQMVELERLRRELAYRKQLNEQQNNMISQQRDQLSRGHEEIAKMDNRILELQERLTKKRCMNQQLANQISAATSAKQAQLRAIQQGMMNRYVVHTLSLALCVIFTILVSFLRYNGLFASKAKINVF